MSKKMQAISIESGRFILKGRIVHFGTDKGIGGLKVVAWDYDLIPKNDRLGHGMTNESGEFEIHFTRKEFSWLLDRKPDLYFEIFNGDEMIKSTADKIIKNADESTSEIIIPLSLHQNLTSMSVISPSECSVFIQVWVDTKSLQNGSTTGVYLVDSNHNNGSSNEGTVNLNSKVSTNTKICWSILNVDLNSDVALSFQNFGNASVWGAGGTPQQVSATVWTGQVEANGTASYAINFNAEKGTGITTTVNPSLTVS